MLHDSKFAPKIGIVQQNSPFPSGIFYLLAGFLGMVSAISLVFGRWGKRLSGVRRVCRSQSWRRSLSRTVGSRAASSWSPLSVTARVRTGGISRALLTVRSCSSPTRRIDKGLVPGVPAFHLSMSLQQFAYRKSISVRCTALSPERKSC